jgi:hypothetical protein
MNSDKTAELRQHLQGVLKELDKLSDQIKHTRDLSESAELLLCLRELVQEQIEGNYRENSCPTAHAAG